MKIFAKAKCYGNLEFDGHIELEITKENDGWYRLPPTESIQTIKGCFQIEAGYSFSGDFILKTGDDAEISGTGTIQASAAPYFGQGYLSTEEVGIMSNLNHFLVRNNTQLSFHYVDVNQLPKLKFLKNQPIHIQFIPNDRIAFSKRNIGFCNIYFCPGE